ncbi:XRE family transcriptional regulator [Serratia quinivorans]
MTDNGVTGSGDKTKEKNKKGRYAAYIESRIIASNKTQAKIAQEIGYDNPNNLSLIKNGKIPVPVEKVAPLAMSLHLDEVKLMMMVLEERYPAVYEFIERNINPLNDQERAIVNAFRVSSGKDRSVTSERLERIIDFIKEV